MRVRVWHNGPGPAGELRALPQAIAAGAEVFGDGGNCGFGEGVNRLLATSDAAVSIVANPDLVLAPGCTSALVAALASSGAVVTGGLLTTGETPPRVNAFRQRLTLDLVGINTDRGRLASELIAEVEGDRPRDRHGGPRSAPHRGFLGPSGALFAVDRARHAAQVGGPLLPRALFLYLEEVAFWIRLRRHGAGIAFEPRAQAVHGFSQSVGQRSARKLYHIERNRLWLARALWGTRRALALLPFTGLRYAAYLVAGLGRPGGSEGQQGDGGAELIRAFRKALREGLGAPLPQDLVEYLRAGSDAALSPYFAPLRAQLKNPVA